MGLLSGTQGLWANPTACLHLQKGQHFRAQGGATLPSAATPKPCHCFPGLWQRGLGTPPRAEWAPESGTWLHFLKGSGRVLVGPPTRFQGTMRMKTGCPGSRGHWVLGGGTSKFRPGVGDGHFHLTLIPLLPWGKQRRWGSLFDSRCPSHKHHPSSQQRWAGQQRVWSRK